MKTYSFVPSLKLSDAIPASVTLLLCCATLALAETPAAPTATPLPKSGNLASSFTGGGSGGGASGSWGSDVLDKTAAPLGGSVSKRGNSWVARVFNNSAETFSADIKVVQMNAKGGVARNDYFSVSLKPNQSTEREFGSANGAISANLELSGWKKLGGKPPASEAGSNPPAVEGATSSVPRPGSNR